jgi:hypothetical protein
MTNEKSYDWRLKAIILMDVIARVFVHASLA